MSGREKDNAADCHRSILVIDDDPDAIDLAKHALKRAHISNPAVSFTDGEMAIAHLKQCISGKAEMPLFVFVDLKMPGVSGFDVLDWVLHQPGLRRLITVVLSTSTARQDVARAFDLGADAYLPKFPPTAEIKTIFQLAQTMLSVEELERALWPGLRPPPSASAAR